MPRGKSIKRASSEMPRGKSIKRASIEGAKASSAASDTKVIIWVEDPVCANSNRIPRPINSEHDVGKAIILDQEEVLKNWVHVSADTTGAANAQTRNKSTATTTTMKKSNGSTVTVGHVKVKGQTVQAFPGPPGKTMLIVLKGQLFLSINNINKDLPSTSTGTLAAKSVNTMCLGIGSTTRFDSSHPCLLENKCDETAKIVYFTTVGVPTVA